MEILAIETSCDETAAAITCNRRVIANVIFSQVNIHRKWGGVYPSLAKRFHQEKIDTVIDKALKNARKSISSLDAIAVTFGPGLVIALEVGLKKAKELAVQYNKPIIPVDHVEGHLYSCFVQNRNGKPKRDFRFPFLGLVVSGGHTSLMVVNNHLKYSVIGRTLDDAAGEALDKGAKMLGLGYPGGPIIEKLALRGNPEFLDLPVPMKRKKTLDFSYSGLKTAFKYRLAAMKEGEINSSLSDLAAAFQGAVFAQIMDRLEKAFTRTSLKTLVVGGGVAANLKLRRMIRKLARKRNVLVYFPPSEKLIGDNAAMIGVASYYKYQNGIYLRDKFDRLDRVARPDLKMWMEV
jgi:N6-L-threonylcarbamoyladenine synthase